MEVVRLRRRLVVVQSLLDVVSIVAMINVGACNLPALEVLIAVGYAAAALTFRSPSWPHMRWPVRSDGQSVADAVTGLVDRYGTTTAVIAAIGVGAVLVASGVSDLNGGPSLG